MNSPSVSPVRQHACGALDLQHWDPALYARSSRQMADLGADALSRLAPRAGERILDLGCGDGRLTRRIAERGARVLGIDRSAAMVQAARAAGCDAEVADAQMLRLPRQFDAVFSHDALHWMRRPGAVAAGVQGLLRPGGRFVAEFPGDGHARRIREALHDGLARRGISPEAIDPWYLPTSAAHRQVLEQAGFEVWRIGSFQRSLRTVVPMRDWLRTFASPYPASLGDTAAAEDYLDEVCLRLSASLRDPDGGWTVHCCLLHFEARRRG